MSVCVGGWWQSLGDKLPSTVTDPDQEPTWLEHEEDPHGCCGIDAEETGWGGTNGDGEFMENKSHLKYCSIVSVLCLFTLFCPSPWWLRPPLLQPIGIVFYFPSYIHGLFLPLTDAFPCCFLRRWSKVQIVSSNRPSLRTFLLAMWLVSSKLVWCFTDTSRLESPAPSHFPD